MPRPLRVVIPGLPHHVTQRGNRKTTTFLDDADHDVYIRLLNQYLRRDQVELWAWALMSNHVHLILVPSLPETLASVIRDTHSNYASYFNQRHGTVGHLWHGRFYSCVLGETHLCNAIRYVEQNPVRARIVQRAETYPWSSAAAHCGLRDDPLLTHPVPPGDWPGDWAGWLHARQPEEEAALIRTHTRLGRPSGSETFLVEMEKRLGRRLRPRRVGRPKLGS